MNSVTGDAVSEANRWQRVKALFEAAVERPPAERAAFVAAATAEDDGLRPEVESLLAADARTVNFDESLPDLMSTTQVRTEWPSGLDRELAGVGDRIGPYDVLEPIDAGSIGQVYRARDTKLNREVALKIVPDVIARHPAHLTQVVREGQVLASLNHPNIAAIYGLEETHGIQILVLELVDGPTLANRIADGSFSLPEALSVASQVAAALAAAHEKGIVHRDLKPANIKLASKGAVKVLDFGLAKVAGTHEKRALAPNGGAGERFDPEAGPIMGSPAYMSPEQARGEPVDTGTDIWAFGCLLYELLTGKRAFDAGSVSDTLDAVLKRDPDWTALPASTPGSIRALLRRCLEKDPRRRLPTIPEAQRALELAQRATRRRWLLAAAVAVLVAAASAVGWTVLAARRAEWARNVEIPRILALLAKDEYTDALALANEANRFIPDDPVLASLWPQFSAAITVTTTPAGADVFMQPYESETEQWRRVGRTPLKDVRLPRGVFQLRIEKAGYEPLRVAAPNPSTLLGNATNRLAAAIVLSLAPTDSARGMVPVPGGAFPVSLNAFSTTDPIPLEPFMIDRFEVTNEQFKRFVESGGYTRAEYWGGLPFMIDGQEASWQEVVAQFRDTTSAPGPATWASGTYPPGMGDRPVNGVSWYEAVAYCRSRGQVLPTIYHWRRAALSPDEMFAPLAPAIIARSNFRHTGPAPIGTFRGLGPYGTYDMAGNVKEWSWNEAQPGHRWIQGGSWSDQPYMLVVRDSAPASDRSPTNGFRCADYGNTQLSEKLSGPVYRPVPSTERAAAVPELFETFRNQYLPVSAPLNSRVESTDTTATDWTKQKISFDAGYEDARVSAYLFLPKGVKPPYQVVVYFPGRSSFVGKMPSDVVQPDFLDFVVRSGRVLVWPIYKGSYERWIPTAAPTLETRRLLFYWRQDLSRLLDVLSQREDIAKNRTAYIGLSYGASVPLSLLSLETRFTAAVLMSAGMGGVPGFPDADALNYAAHITMPLLLLSGEHDFVYPLETVAKPLFERIGTNADQKRHVVFDAGHMMFPRGPMNEQILAWLDRYLGPVEPRVIQSR
jgi:formylglycine-generating enzyme required for sulfatase activity/predicted esterase